MAKHQSNPAVTFTSNGEPLPIWGIHAGMVIESTEYFHDEQSLCCAVRDQPERPKPLAYRITVDGEPYIIDPSDVEVIYASRHPFPQGET